MRTRGRSQDGDYRAIVQLDMLFTWAYRLYVLVEVVAPDNNLGGESLNDLEGYLLEAISDADGESNDSAYLDAPIVGIPYMG